MTVTTCIDQTSLCPVSHELILIVCTNYTVLSNLWRY